jgi:DNA-binding CsgD family transcriptional regulator/tetratricopeptide (TPR) repeat protein
VLLVGREYEQGVIAGLLEGVRDHGGALVVAGEPGVGKSTLLTAAAEMAEDRGLLVLGTTGVQSEMNLPFAALHQLLRPVLPHAEKLPPPQRNAIQAAFAMTESSVPELFLIALAALELLSEVAGSSPVVLIADDAQWLDRASADVLTFVARRVQWDPIVLLASVRNGHDGPLVAAGLPELRLKGLADRAARDLLDARSPELAPAVRERLLAEAGGNPLALLELPTALSAGVRGGEVALPRHLPLTVRLERAFAARAADLPAATRALLVVAAADDSGVLDEIMTAAEAVAGARPRVEDLDPALRAGLIQIDGPVARFRHPLVRSAMYQAMTIAERHAAHAALAEVLAGDPDRRVWHRAAAAVGRDAAVAAELEEAADRARRRGDLVTAAVGYERAAALAGDRRRRGVLLLRAAEVASELGRSEMVRRLLREADGLELGPPERARSLWLTDAFHRGSARDPAPVRALVETARAMTAEGDSDLALSLLSAAARRCYWGDLSGPQAAEVLGAADRTGAAPDDPRLLYIQALAAPLERGAVVLGQLASLDLPDDPDDPGALLLLAAAATNVGVFDQAFSLYEAAAAQLRDQGRLGVLARILSIQSWSAILVADFPVALTSAEEGAALAAETVQPLWQMQAWTAQATIAALRGDHATADDLATRIERAALPLGAASSLALVQYARGLSALGRGQHDEAYNQLRRLYDPADPAHHHMFASICIGDLAEAAAHSGHRDEARSLTSQVESVARQTPSPWLHATLRYAQAVLADDENAEGAFRAAADAQDTARWPFLRARLQLAFGEWLRRHRRTAESRIPLRDARDAFDAFGVTPWGDRARQELRATGETSNRRAVGTLDVLTTQELQIVQMAAGGLSNREIGRRLYLSHRTVESHLYRAFPKLGITSRAQLSGAAREQDASATPSGMVAAPGEPA